MLEKPERGEKRSTLYIILYLVKKDCTQNLGRGKYWFTLFTHYRVTLEVY